MREDPVYKWRSLTEQRRFRVFIGVLFGVLVILLGRYAYLMLTPMPNAGGSRGQTVAERGSIFDRNGRVLAIQTRLANISVWKPDVDDFEELSRDIAPLLDMGVEETLQKIEGSSADFVYLKKNVDQGTIRAVETELEKGFLNGVGVEPVTGRIYPEGMLAGTILGFVGADNAGLGGIEYAFDRELSARDVWRDVQRSGTSLNRGNRVYLTIDANIQYILESIANRVLDENQAEAVMLIAMEPESGEILGQASVPGFDPNNFRLSSEAARMDRPSLWAYEPGSVFKVFSLASMLEMESAVSRATFVCNGSYEHTTNLGETIVIGCLEVHGNVSIRDIIIKSCNAGAAYASDMVGENPFYTSLENFGFGKRTGAGLPGETAGFLRPPARWSARSKPTISMGQEIAVSALQMMQAATAIANDGILVHPRIVSKVTSADGKTETPFETAPPRRVLSPETARTMRGYMVDVTSNIGTGWRANVDDLSLAVKTGTAQVIDPETRSYSETDFIASCIALLPADHPRLVIYIAIVKPKGWSYLGGQIAAPPIREAAESLVNYLGIPRGRSPQVSHSGSVRLATEGLPDIEGYLPDFTGYSKRLLLPLLLLDEITFDIQGEGWVVRQNPPPGALVTRGMKVELFLE
ncbi:MAG: transpeptidase family protein [Spirochaetaceae bacterium]|jgi:cell division protein FtsI (penicillin-binding protein 3)|nr:transpeptidase family protein [Spirochaetaceae bacterium]